MKQLDPKAVWLFFFNSLVFLGFLLLIFASIWAPILITESNWSLSGPLFLIIIILLILCFVWAKLAHHFYRYELTDIGFRKESGVIYKKYVTIPYDRIQNVDIYRGILARILGLSDLQIQTAGASGAVVSEGRLPGLSREIAEQLRDEVLQRAKQSRNQGL